MSADDALGRLATARSFLFVPGDRPDRFARALASSADCVVVDLEDAVAPQGKGAARKHAAALVSQAIPERPIVVRTNHPDSTWGPDDLVALAGAPALAGVMVPKADGPELLARVSATLGAATSLLPLVETAAGILAAPALATVRGVVRLTFGHLDLGAELGIDPAEHERLAPARLALVLASAAAGIAAPVDGVTPDVRDLDAVGADTRAARASGFTARLCIHPDQVDAVHDALAPDEAELTWARSVVAASADVGVAVVDGQMVDRPVLIRARSVLERATPTTTR